MSFLSIKDVIYLAIITFVATLLIWWHHEAVVEGEDKVTISQAAALQKQKDAVTAQQLQDKQDSQDAIQQLVSELNAVRAAAPRLSTLRLCGFAHNTSPLPVASESTGSLKSPDAPAGTAAPVPGGDTAGTDIGTAVHDIAFVGAVLGAYRDATVEWALKQSQ